MMMIMIIIIMTATMMMVMMMEMKMMMMMLAMVMVMMMMVMMMIMMVIMMMLARGRWWRGCWGGGRWWSWGGRPIPRPWSTLCASLRSRNAHGHVRRAEIYRKNAGRFSRGQRFVRACAVEMHMDCHKRHFVRKFTRKMPYPYPAASVSCEPAQSKCTWTCQKKHFVRKFTGKCRTLLPRPAFCASLRSRDEHGHVTRGILCRNLQGKCQTHPVPPRLDTGP